MNVVCFHPARSYWYLRNEQDQANDEPTAHRNAVTLTTDPQLAPTPVVMCQLQSLGLPVPRVADPLRCRSPVAITLDDLLWAGQAMNALLGLPE